MALPIANLVRFHTDDQGTSGRLVCGAFQSFSLELPWHNNISNFSCIPEYLPPGSYTCKYTKSSHLHKWTYELLRVKDRAGVRIHSGNWAGDTRLGYKTHVLGCILLCKKIGSINGGQRMALISSDTVKEFERYMDYKDFTLNVQWLKKEQ